MLTTELGLLRLGSPFSGVCRKAGRVLALSKALSPTSSGCIGITAEDGALAGRVVRL